jgi:N-acetyl-gamma-glutamyl-phosphate reductase
MLVRQVAEPLVSGNGATAKARIAVLGASGYTGEEVVRLLALHPNFEVTVLTGETQAGKVGGTGK